MVAFQKQLALLLKAQEFLRHTLTNSFHFKILFQERLSQHGSPFVTEKYFTIEEKIIPYTFLGEQ